MPSGGRICNWDGLVCLNGDGTYEVTTTDDNGCFTLKDTV